MAKASPIGSIATAQEGRQLVGRQPIGRQPVGRQSGGDLVARTGDQLARLLDKPLAGGLYLVATPIGNLGDISLRALATLARVDVIYCEDTRHSRRLLDHFGIERPLKSYHEHNGAQRRPRILAELAAGKKIALISDAGTPLVSDPGFKLVREAADAGHDVTALPGPSAVLTALAAAGLPTASFYFGGFLPPKQNARQLRLGALKAYPATLVFFEAPSRLAALLADIDTVLGRREVAVARELTKLHEELRRGPPDELAAWAKSQSPRGEMVVLVGPPAKSEPDDALIRRALAPMLEEMSLRDAARQLAAKLDVGRSRVYDLGLALKSAGKKRGGS